MSSAADLLNSEIKSTGYLMTQPGASDLKVVPGGACEYRWEVVHGPESRAIFRKAMQAVLAAR